MYKRIIGFLLLLAPLYVCAQMLEIKQVELPIISEKKTTISNFRGWTMRTDGIWISAKNKIPYDDLEEFSRSSQENDLGKENINKIVLHEVIFDHKTFYLMLIYFNDGKFEFPVLRKGWDSYESVYFYMFPKSSFKNFIPQNPTYNEPKAISVEAYCSGLISKSSSVDVYRMITDVMLKTRVRRTYNYANLVISILPVKKDKKDKVMFRLTKTYVQSEIYTYYLQKEVMENNFSRSYFEGSLDDFRNFVNFFGSSDDDPKSFLDFYNFGVKSYIAGNYKSALLSFNKALELDPQTKLFLLYAYRGNSKYSLNDFYGAISDYTRALGMKPTDELYLKSWLQIWINRGVARHEMKDKEGACSDWFTAYSFGLSEADAYIKKCSKDDLLIDSTASKPEMKERREVIIPEPVRLDADTTPKVDPIVATPIAQYQESVRQDVDVKDMIVQAESQIAPSIFRVQVGATNDKNAADILRKKYSLSGELFFYQHQGLNKYCVGNYKTLEEAKAKAQTLKEKNGISDCFVVEFKNNQRVNIYP